MPESGPGAVAGWGRRFAALGIDWAMSTLAATALFGRAVLIQPDGGRTFLEIFGPTVVFAIEVWVLTTLLGGSAGQLVLRVQVRRVNGSPLDAGRALVRTLLILLVIPPLIFNRDQQGLHDLAVDSIAVRR